jgi:predicted unusual protein kinase regulating ubiquinone biosynthesis (AarF/ABC1/UbiB family)
VGLLYRQQEEARAARLLQKQSGRLFANGLLQLGPLYIKLGQIISCREKLLPNEWKEALEKLQDRVPSRSGQAALDLAYSSIGSKEQFDRLFSDFTTTPLAAASLGQVHKAVLRETNDIVAVKVQRPFLREIYDQDFVMLLNIATIMDKFMGKRVQQVGGVAQSWTDIITDARTILYREIDYRDEADNAIRFAQDFGLGKNGTATKTTRAVTRTNEPLPSAASWLRTPYVYRNASSEKILVMEYVPSIKITDTQSLKQANVTAEDKEYLADSLARSYLRQFCVNRFFSTDPHPGNLGVEAVARRVNGGRNKPRLVFYDFGQACELNSDQADGILDVIEAIVDSDATRCVDAFEKMGVLTNNVDVDKVRAKVQDNFEKGLVKVRKKKLKKAGYKFKKEPAAAAAVSRANQANSTSAVSATKEDSEVMKYFKLPTEYAFVARAISQMDGVGKSLDPDFDFISSAAPNIVEIKGATSYLKDEFNKWVNSVKRRVTDCWMNIVNEK